LAGLVDDVVLELNAGVISGGFNQWMWTPLSTYSDKWQPSVTKEISATAAALKTSRTSFSVVLTPVSWEISPVEQAYFRLRAPDSAAPMTESFGDEQLMLDAVRPTGVQLLDTFPSFLDAEKSAFHAPLFGTRDFHMTAAGRQLLAAAIVRQLESERPWLHR
jgi:hypothetical protein